MSWLTIHEVHRQFEFNSLLQATRRRPCSIYRDDFGVRVEDTVWISDKGPVSLTRYGKSLAV